MANVFQYVSPSFWLLRENLSWLLVVSVHRELSSQSTWSAFRLFSPEIRRLRPWISTNWLRWVQSLSTLSMVTSLFALIAAILVITNKEGFKSSRRVLTAAILHGVAGVLMFITVILFGIYGRRRDWMMNWQFNWFGWSFHLAIVACILHLFTAMMAGYQGSNK